jgi:multidrug efflux pump subunit AcrB
MLSSYVNGIVSRFVAGQDTRTVQARIAFLEQFNKLAEVARESYKWQRHMNGGRAKLEEDTEDAKAESALQQVRADLEIGALDTDIRRHEKMLQIERLKRELAELNKPAPPTAPPPVALPAPPVLTPAQVREQNLQDLNEHEKRVIEEMRITKVNPTLSKDQKQRKLNALEDRLAQIHDEQSRLI